MNPFAKEEKQRTYVDVESVLPRMRYEGPYKRSLDIADFYGFRLLRPVKIEKDDRGAVGPTERVALIRHYLEQGLDGCTQPVHLSHTAKIPYHQDIELRLDIVGTEKSVAETLLIHTVLTILKEHGIEDIVLHINSIGGKASAEQYLKELVLYCREYLNDLDAHCREAIKDDPFGVFTCTNKHCRSILARGPQSIAYLSEGSRTRFYEILEGLEELGIAYTIDPHLVGNRYTTSHTVFEIREVPEENEDPGVEVAPPRVWAHGERYDYLARRAGLGRNIPAAGATITLQGFRSANERYQPYKIVRPRAPKAYLVHLGLPAKRWALVTLEMLRAANIPVATLMAEESLSEQLELATLLAVPAVIIIGQKEVVDGTAIVRNQETRSQVSVPRVDLPRYLKRMRI